MTLTPLQEAKRAARKLRATLSKMEAHAAWMREQGKNCSADWWKKFGEVFHAVQRAESAVHKAREDERKAKRTTARKAVPVYRPTETHRNGVP